MDINSKGVVVAMLAVAVVVGSAGCGGIGSTVTRSPIRPGSVALPDVRLPSGEWAAKGTVIRAVNSADAPAGTKLVRPWTFRKVCDRECHTLFLRQTLYGPSETKLLAHAGVYTASFPPVTVPCAHYAGEDAGTALSYDTYRLRWTANRRQILAIQHQRSVSRSCPGTQTTRWVATRVEPAAVPAPGP